MSISKQTYRNLAVVCVCTAGLVACGETIGEQTLAGGAVGAGAAVLTSGSVLQGAAIGAAGNLAYCQLNPGRCRGY